jgi:uncharacterized protein YbbC (DUF1343 family)
LSRPKARTRPRVRSGLEVLLASPGRLRGLRLGLVANPASVTSSLQHAAVALARLRGLRLTTLFGPEHGIWANAQDLVELGHSRDPRTGLAVFSLYGDTRVPTPEMLSGLDLVLFDLQDVGARYYTFIYTLLHLLEACQREGKKVMVLDRPNPLGGVDLEGNLLDPAYASFVGLHPLPVRHGMTPGELALLFNEERGIGADLEIVRMAGWRRSMHFEETGLPWVLPSPNMPSVDTAFVYPGGCLIEGTNLSEGRGTTRPFELVGAPWLDPWQLAAALRQERLPGVVFRPVFFTPTFQKHQGQLCGGVQVHVTDRQRFRAYLCYLVLIFHARRQDPAAFAWRQPPYEYELEKLPFDVLCGTGTLRDRIEAGISPRGARRAFTADLARFRGRRMRFLLYP